MNETSLTNSVYKFEPPVQSWLFHSSQQRCGGMVTIEKVQAIREKLTARAPLGIEFNASKIDSFVFGGTCSAMSLAFIKNYFAAVEKHLNIKESLLSLEPLLKTSCLKMRNRQLAFNTIEVVKSIPRLDYAKEKVESLARYYGFHITFASEMVDTQSDNYLEQLKSTLASMPEGVYFVRILKPSENEKLEERGHSMVYIRSSQGSYYYDPNNGAMDLSDQNHAEIIAKSFAFCYSIFGVTQARFYQLSNSFFI